tara:strand:+ start:203 stop:592 length:390 start_codon:yes stop_codon:yes gene_type:complete
MFNFKKPTAQMLGRWQPWHKGHTELFKKSLAEIGQVCIMIRDVQNIDAGMGNDDNPFHYDQVVENIKQELSKEGFTYYQEYVIIIVPNIVNISYGRGVGYTFTEHDLGADIHSISATKIRKKLRDEGKL